jgi:aryl-alcohol dehydrogenase-like predicted oxidoreductase
MDWILGTANFGARYGITNGDLELNEAAVNQILTTAAELGIKYLDTAPSYGRSEVMIGSSEIANHSFSTMTKVKITSTPGDSLKSVLSSIERLRSKQVHTILIHNASELFNFDRKMVNEELSEIESYNPKFQIGASVYEEDEIERLASDFPQIKAFQVPENILDQRLRSSSLVQSLADTGYLFYVRSIFLQGLITTKSRDLPKQLQGAARAMAQLEGIAEKNKTTVLSLALGYLKLLPWSSGTLIGTTNVAQLRETIKEELLSLVPSELPEPLALNVVDPRRWVDVR